MKKVMSLNCGASRENEKKGERARPVFSFASVDANGRPQLIVAVRDREKFEKPRLITHQIPYSNFYVDRNHYDVIVADPVLGSHYFLHNVYYIEDGVIYMAGITAKFAARGMKPGTNEDAMSTHLIFGWEFDEACGTFTVDSGSMYSVRFNPNYFSQERSLENFEKINQRRAIYEKLYQYVPPYDRPRNFIQRAFFIDGALSVKKYGLSRSDHSALSSILAGGFGAETSSPRSCYFSLEQFYLSGVAAALNFH